jgi:hypothetical protein
MSLDWGRIHERLKRRIESAGVRVDCRSLGRETTGIFDGRTITTNCECDLETRCHNMGHAFGHIVQWSVATTRCERLYEALYAAKERRREDPQGLERALEDFRRYEEEASGYAAWLLVDTDNSAALQPFTHFARADIEAIVSYHRDGIAPIWNDFFAEWLARVARGEIEYHDFVPRPIPEFAPRPIAPQEVIRAVR